MNVQRLIRVIAGSFIMLSVVLYSLQHPEAAVFAGPNWLWFTVFVGANLFQSGFTKWCLMEIILKKIGVPA
ncbi:MAG TPA: DUF2892 domain-containing protein [Calditrichia bacterium]|nr:DUF2892 domain-containing protein [Calditrichia bacterium]